MPDIIKEENNQLKILKKTKQEVRITTDPLNQNSTPNQTAQPFPTINKNKNY